MTRKRQDDLPWPASTRSNKWLGQKDPTLVITVVIATTLIATLINKWLTTSTEYKFPFPYFVIFFQVCVGWMGMMVWRLLGSILPVWARAPLFWNTNLRSLVPLACLHTTVLYFSPIFLQHVQITNYAFVRSLSIPATLAILSLYGTPVPRQTTKISALHTLGFLVGILDDLHFSLEGVFFGVIWAILLALYGVWIKQRLPSVGNDVSRLLFSLTVIAIVPCGLVVFLSGELAHIGSVYFLSHPGFWLQLIITTITGFSVNIAMLLLIKYTSPLTHCITVTSKM
ncbi:hypothetical protein PHYBLDRAFT_165068 [Phycomyces blakesleeanus NRRL 1555(-)]|uniref:GDP-mannose transporter n=1 Tax=Phycomyces blakesleeanus (strain ATCC 8743b / DSM 1359 / FGSC 10004 / NBRC 33097 / NRRL 1555) TaxID=763407 RepID=A0A167NRV6_PHYB8|nr:hypothetical protein PHYBLDRAFT_165068 [Phycomyces blakesleeanus NRRL 1555(-)]OAD76540.1 hypothetical protein PHYBLDRAFT_165068 [Phycomyces blakesleeanus NRRL 1555(-)]|eukprot:XP_018294580.1 hypothetical protein PHYBLDRAFT_165068 [Phycomyces blakesleeanus NRRL 1555(-)]